MSSRKKGELEGKRFLITQPMVHGINGSTVVALELAKYLTSIGAKVVVYTYYSNKPAIKLFDAADIKVYSSVNEPRFKLSDFDYIWVHSQVLPISIVRALSRRLPDQMPKFIFNHMSPLTYISDERPYIYDLENKLSSLSTFISDATRAIQKDYLDKDIRTALFANPAPIEFSKLNLERSTKLNKILIVSSHPPEELIEAIELLRRYKLTVDIYGAKSKKYQLITPELLSNYDMVITIGKTAQYCLVAGIPVYIYDHFGGNGYLSESSFRRAARRNFSGRDGSKRAAADLYRDIRSGYKDAVGFHQKYKGLFINKYSIEKVLPKLFNKVGAREIEVFDKKYCKTVESAQLFAKRQFINSSRRQIAEKKHESLKQELDSLKRSESYILGRMILLPVRLCRKPLLYAKKFYISQSLSE